MARGDLTRAVRNIADERGVCERTVWRWTAAMRASGSRQLPAAARTCDYCGRRLPRQATIRRRYCDPICRVYFNRARRKLPPGR